MQVMIPFKYCKIIKFQMYTVLSAVFLSMCFSYTNKREQ